MAAEDVYELAYREAVRALEHQHAALAELRGRASALIATAAISTSFLGTRAFATSRPLGWLAIGCFALLSVCVLVVVWPRATWRFDFDSDDLIAVYITSADDGRSTTAAAIHRDLALRITESGRANALLLSRISRAFRVGACLLATQVLATALAAAVGR